MSTVRLCWWHRKWRNKLVGVVAALPPCTIGVEACPDANHWARVFAGLGHTVRPMAPKFLVPYRISGRRGKNDAADAEAICEAVRRPNMRLVPTKSLEQQGRLTVHRMRQAFIEQRTGMISRIRSLRSEFGIVMPLKAATVRRQAGALSGQHRLDERTNQYDRHIAQMAPEDARAQPLMKLRGVGETTATGMAAMVGNGQQFD